VYTGNRIAGSNPAPSAISEQNCGRKGCSRQSIEVRHALAASTVLSPPRYSNAIEAAERFMGLDLVVEGCAKPGHETEWRRLLERSFADDRLSEAEIARFNDISISRYERIGAPRVGVDASADAWIIEARKAQTLEEVAAALKEYSGYYVLRLVKCDGVPIYSNAGLYDGVDEISFRGEFLKSCGSVIDERLLDAAWEHKLPEAAVAYGRALLAAADAAETSPCAERQDFPSHLGLESSAEPVPLPEQLDIVRAAGRWFVFWGERGHPIRAYF
jgi:hypothetical protein